jgi:hypothetical protein
MRWLFEDDNFVLFWDQYWASFEKSESTRFLTRNWRKKPEYIKTIGGFILGLYYAKFGNVDLDR